MLVAVIADTHLRAAGRLPPACRRVLAQSELIVHAGDIVAASALDELTAVGPPVAAVAGNVDEAELAARLPERIELELGGARLGVIHDAGDAPAGTHRARARWGASRRDPRRGRLARASRAAARALPRLRRR